MPVAGAMTALRLIFSDVVMRRSLLQAGALPNSQPPTPGRMAADGDVAEGRADRRGLQGQGIRTISANVSGSPLVRFVDSGGGRGPTRLTRRGRGETSVGGHTTTEPTAT
jgi:hypothetical protein